MNKVLFALFIFFFVSQPGRAQSGTETISSCNNNFGSMWDCLLAKGCPECTSGGKTADSFKSEVDVDAKKMPSGDRTWLKLRNGGWLELEVVLVHDSAVPGTYRACDDAYAFIAEFTPDQPVFQAAGGSLQKATITMTYSRNDSFCLVP